MSEAKDTGMITTLENVRLKAGDRILVKVEGASFYPAKVIDASDPAKLRVKLRNGSVLWTGRRSVESILEYGVFCISPEMVYSTRFTIRTGMKNGFSLTCSGPYFIRLALYLSRKLTDISLRK